MHSKGAKTEYQVTVTEILSRVVKVNFLSAQEAVEKVKSLYRKEVIVLDWCDFIELIIKASDTLER